MRKLLVLLVALVTVAAFAAVNFSGNIRVYPQLTYDASAASFSWAINTRVRLFLSASDEDETTGFAVSLVRQGSSAGEYVQVLNDQVFDTTLMLGAGTYVWKKLYPGETFNITARLGYMWRGIAKYAANTYFWNPYFEVSNQTNAVALDFAMKSGDLSDTLSLYVFAPTATSVDLDLYNKLTFTFVELELFLYDALSGFGSSEINAGVGLKLDAAKALNIENASLNAFAGLNVGGDPTDLNNFLKDYIVGVNLGYGTINGSVAYAKGNTLELAVKTTALPPLTIGADIVFTDLTDAVNNMQLAAYADWKDGLLSHSIYMKYRTDTKEATIGWAISASF